MRCMHCGQTIAEGEKYTHAGKELCEDCYLEAVSVPKTCDPLSVRAARVDRERRVLKGRRAASHSKNILNFIREKQRVSGRGAEQFNLSPGELEKHFAVLRHCEPGQRK